MEWIVRGEYGVAGNLFDAGLETLISGFLDMSVFLPSFWYDIVWFVVDLIAKST